MKHFLYLFLFLFSGLAFGQDDMYFDPATDYEKNYRAEQKRQADKQYEAAEENAQRSGYGVSDYDSRYYSRRLQRFHNAGPAFGAANPFFSPGVQVFVGAGPNMGWNNWNRWNRWDRWGNWNRWNRWNSPWNSWNSWNNWNTWNSPWNSWNTWGSNPWLYNDPFFCPPTPYYNNWDSNNNSRPGYYGPRYNTPVNDDFRKSRLRTTGNTDVNSRSSNGQTDQNEIRRRSTEQQAPSQSRFSGQEQNRNNTQQRRSFDRNNTQYSQDDFQRTYRTRDRNNSTNRSYRNGSNDNYRRSNNNYNRTRSSSPRSYQPRSNSRSSGSINRSSTPSRSRSTRSSGSSNLRRSGGNR